MVINNNHSGSQVAAQEVSDGRGGRRLEVQVDEAFASAVTRLSSKTSAAMTQPRLLTGRCSYAELPDHIADEGAFNEH